MRELIDRYYSDALRCGIRTAEFWDEMSPGEIMDTIEAAADRRAADAEQRWEVTREIAYLEPLLIASAVWSDRRHRYPKKEDVFPEREKKSTVPEWQRQKAGMSAWVDAYNARQKRRTKRRHDPPERNEA